MAATLEAIKYKDGQLEILNQLALPHETIFEKAETIQDGHAAIKTMKTRGAPAIAIVAALSLSVDLQARQARGEFKTAEDVHTFVLESLEYLKTSRPTAVNLFDAAAKLSALVTAAKHTASDAASLVAVYVQAAEKMLIDDVQDNKNIGKYGAEYIYEKATDKSNICVLTHCNTGSLATAGWGTALGIIRDLHKNKHLKRAYCTETRPYNQGSRLTAYELVYEQIPATLVCDSMASALLRLHPEVQAIVVGADRVAANGDTANKIGTYQLAITAKYHNIPFIVAAPTTSIDTAITSGSQIVIEQRPANELVTTTGLLVGSTNESKTIRTAAQGIDVWNPSFDVTPASLISAIVTEKGVAIKLDGQDQFDMPAFLASSSSA
ncbi:methylthioribose-1-phosphate isomerase-like protein [Syncephalastrum racemosum]|uniref:Methylthioribose-1-phosphate isomerase n=1 Tax=Syncephalastrum racemosum TaxID=13706 RepID=A0A1X2H9H6_SYNRA|nr:methylthioribose-1-phosphate isomerase-like protein [Syncephalastrum racemosum]